MLPLPAKSLTTPEPIVMLYDPSDSSVIFTE